MSLRNIVGPEVFNQKIAQRKRETAETKVPLKLVTEPKVLQFPIVPAEKEPEDFDHSFLRQPDAAHELPLGEIFPLHFYIDLVESLKSDELKTAQELHTQTLPERIANRLKFVSTSTLDSFADTELREALLSQIKEDFLQLHTIIPEVDGWETLVKQLIKTIRKFPGLTEGNSTKWMMALEGVGTDVAMLILQDIELGVCEWKDIPETRQTRESVKQIDRLVKELQKGIPSGKLELLAIDDVWKSCLNVDGDKARMVRTILMELVEGTLVRDVVTNNWLDYEVSERATQGLKPRRFIEECASLSLNGLNIIDSNKYQEYIQFLLPAHIKKLIGPMSEPMSPRVHAALQYFDQLSRTLTMTGLS